MIQTIDKRLVVILSSAFIVTVIVGTLSHELGHFVVAKYFGYNPHLGYSFTQFGDEALWNDTSEQGIALARIRGIWMLAGGPLETMLVGTVGLILLFLLRKRSKRSDLLTALEWTLVVLSFFWMREVTNFVGWLCKIMYAHKFSFRMDEVKISQLLDVPIWFLPLIGAVCGAIVISIVTIKFIPNIQRPTFFVSLSIGGIVGSLLWFEWLGPILLP